MGSCRIALTPHRPVHQPPNQQTEKTQENLGLFQGQAKEKKGPTHRATNANKRHDSRSKFLGAVCLGKSEGEDIDEESSGETGKADTGLLDRSVAGFCHCRTRSSLSSVQNVFYSTFPSRSPKSSLYP